MRTTDTTIRVRFAETDAQGVVYHSNYLVYFEVGRSEFVRQMGSSYVEWERQGIYLVVVEASCQYRSAARYDDLLTIRTTLERVRSRGLAFRYEVFHAESGKLLAEGRTVHVCVNREGRIAEIPSELRTPLLMT